MHGRNLLRHCCHDGNMDFCSRCPVALRAIAFSGAGKSEEWRAHGEASTPSLSSRAVGVNVVVAGGGVDA